MLTLDQVYWKTPDGEEIVKGVSLEIAPGRLTVVTGPNGGGKTSIAKLVAGLASPTGGRILLDGEEITGLDITERAKRGIAYAFQQPVRFKGVTVRDLLEIAAGEALSEEDMCSVLGKVGLCARDYVDRPVDASLSGGESKRIEIATVLARRDARFLVFDEPEVPQSEGGAAPGAVCHLPPGAYPGDRRRDRGHCRRPGSPVRQPGGDPAPASDRGEAGPVPHPSGHVSPMVLSQEGNSRKEQKKTP